MRCYEFSWYFNYPIYLHIPHTVILGITNCMVSFASCVQLMCNVYCLQYATVDPSNPINLSQSESRVDVPKFPNGLPSRCAFVFGGGVNNPYQGDGPHNHLCNGSFAGRSKQRECFLSSLQSITGKSL